MVRSTITTKLGNLHRYSTFLSMFNYKFSTKLNTPRDYTDKLLKSQSEDELDMLLNMDMQKHFIDLIYFKTMHGLPRKSTFLFVLDLKSSIVVPSLLLKTYVFKKSIVENIPHALSTVYST